MFQELSIKNFQSHKETEIEFDEGVNVLVGSSDQGKSAALRAIIWAVTNRPLGTDDIVSHWARDEKNKIADTMSVQIKTDSGVVLRKRTADKNIYKLANDKNIVKKFEAVNKEVPQDVIDFFRLSDVNIQQQHDAPFLLSASASDVAKYFNKIVRLDVIDTVLGNAESARRETNKKIKETDNEKKELEKQLESYCWIEQAQKLADSLIKIDERIETYNNEICHIENDIETYKIQKEFLKDFPDIKKANALIEKIENIEIDYSLRDELESGIEKYKKVNRDRKIFEMIQSGKETIKEIEKLEIDITKNNDEFNNLMSAIEEYTDNKKLTETEFDKKKAFEIITEIESIKLQNEYNNLRTLNSEIIEYDRLKNDIKKLDEEVIDYKKELPDECPLCGAPMEKNI